jgi:hypothetical protein
MELAQSQVKTTWRLEEKVPDDVSVLRAMTATQAANIDEIAAVLIGKSTPLCTRTTPVAIVAARLKDEL